MRRTTVRQVALVAVVLVATAATAATAAVPAGHAGAAQEECTFPVTATDATGTEVTVEEEPQRVVVLQASAAQVMWEIGAEEKVVGMPVKSYTAYLNGSEERTDVVNDDGSVNRERVVGLEPDLVLAPNVVRNETVEQLRGDGLTVYRTGFGKSLDDIYAKTELFGRMVGRCEAADRTVTEMQTEIETIRAAVEGRERPRVLYTFFNFTAGNGTFIHEVIETAGGDNVAANAGVAGYQQVNEEVVADRDPEWVVVPSDAPVPQGEPWESTTAYRENQTLQVNANYMNQPGPRVVRPMRRLAEAFHPGAFDEANATATPADATVDSPTGTPATGISQPGFGVAAALAALAGLILLFARE